MVIHTCTLRQRRQSESRNPGCHNLCRLPARPIPQWSCSQGLLSDPASPYGYRHCRLPICGTGQKGSQPECCRFQSCIGAVSGSGLFLPRKESSSRGFRFLRVLSRKTHTALAHSQKNKKAYAIISVSLCFIW